MVINLLPPKFKQEKENKKTVKTMALFLAGVFLLLVIATGGIFAADFFIKKDLHGIAEKISEQNQTILKYKETENELKNINSKLVKIDNINKTKVFWSSLIFELSKSTPSNLQIKTLTLSQENKKVSITGYAETRNDIAGFKEKLEDSKYFKNVTFSSSVHNESQGNFSFNMACEIEEIK